MGIADWLTRKSSQPIWVVKQIDDALLHLCGKGSVMDEGGAAKLLERLRSRSFSGPVRMGGNGAVLNSAQFAVLVPEEDFSLISDNEAAWLGRRWQIAWVPQRCWLHDGHLTSQQVDFQGQPRRISIEDISGIRAKAESPRRKSEFISMEALRSSHWYPIARDDDEHQQ